VTSFVSIDTPVGPITVVVSDGAVTNLHLDEVVPEREWREDRAATREAAAQLRAYFAGDLQSFDLPLRAEGTDFQQAVWSALRQIPYGEVATYGDIARRVGRPTASRAVGAANGRNPIAIVIPCHRVIGSDGTLTGYGGGMWRKRWLLSHEGRADLAPEQGELL
jgi:methylated-DNA-[protein]-cysteine S-methyltransferase